MPDFHGAPSYMAALQPVYSFTLDSGISPGQNVPVVLDSGPSELLQPGDVLILDRMNAGLTEACVIASTTGPANQLQLTFQRVLNAHAPAATAESGLVITQKRYMPGQRPLTFLSRTPVMKIISGVGRYAYGRKGDVADWNMNQYNLLAAMSKFGGPPVWELWRQPLANIWDSETGDVWAPAGVMLEYYSEIKIRYVAGFSQDAIPQAVKLACAELIRAIANSPSVGNFKSVKAGDTGIQRFTASSLDDDTKTALRPFAARIAV